MPQGPWKKLNLPEQELKQVKINAAILGQTMGEYVSDLVKRDERARGVSRQTSTTELPPIKEARVCRP